MYSYNFTIQPSTLAIIAMAIARSNLKSRVEIASSF